MPAIYSAAAVSPDDLAILGELERKVLWLASWTIHTPITCATAPTA